jgi:hypothetical protein
MANHFVTSFNFSIFVFIAPLDQTGPSPEIIESALILEKFGLTAFCSCAIDDYICRYTWSIPGETGNLIFLNRATGFYFKLKGPISPISVSSWFSSGMGKPRGPGNNAFLQWFYEVRAYGGFQYYVLFSPVVVIFILVTVIVTVICFPAGKVHET